MRMNWIVLVVSISILIVLCDAKKKKFSKNEASEGSKSNDESMKPKEAKIRDEKPWKAKYKSDEKVENKQTGRKLNVEDKAEKTSTGSQETVTHHEEEFVSKSIAKTEPATTLEAGASGASPSVQGEPAKEKKTTKGKPAKKTNKQLKKEKAAVGKGPVPDAVEEPAGEVVNEKAEL